MHKQILFDEIMAMAKQQRVHLINSLGGFKSVALVGTSDSLGNENLAIFSSFFHIGANPPLIGMIFRPSPPERDTMNNGISEFDATGLTPAYKNNFFAPFVSESKVQLGIELKQKLDISINNTIMIIGEITQIFIPENCLQEDGFIDLEKANSLTCSGLDSYHKTIQLDRLSYAKPDKEITSIIQN